MTGADLIQILMKDENVDKDIAVVGVEDDEFDIDGVDDTSSLIKIKIDDLYSNEDECSCECDLCRHCLRS